MMIYRPSKYIYKKIVALKRNSLVNFTKVRFYLYVRCGLLAYFAAILDARGYGGQSHHKHAA